MKQLDLFILEKLHLGKTLHPDNIILDDNVLMDDYGEVASATTKAEKLKIANKYGIKSNKIREIQLAILDILRDNRHNKKDFTDLDIRAFFRYDVPDSYNKLKEYLDKEPIEFVEFLKEHTNKLIDKNPYVKKYQFAPERLSYADRRLINRRNNLEKYLNSK